MPKEPAYEPEKERPRDPLGRPIVGRIRKILRRPTRLAADTKPFACTCRCHTVLSGPPEVLSVLEGRYSEMKEKPKAAQGQVSMQLCATVAHYTRVRYMREHQGPPINFRVNAHVNQALDSLPGSPILDTIFQGRPQSAVNPNEWIEDPEGGDWGGSQQQVMGFLLNIDDEDDDVNPKYLSTLSTASVNEIEVVFHDDDTATMVAWAEVLEQGGLVRTQVGASPPWPV